MAPNEDYNLPGTNYAQQKWKEGRPQYKPSDIDAFIDDPDYGIKKEKEMAEEYAEKIKTGNSPELVEEADKAIKGMRERKNAHKYKK